MILIELRQAPISYQDYHMLLLNSRRWFPSKRLENQANALRSLPLDTACQSPFLYEDDHML